MQWIESVITLFFTSTLLVALLTWIGKQLISHFLKRDVENFKAKLNKDIEIARRQLSFELDKRIAEHQLKMERLYDQRSSVIAKTYGLLVSNHKSTINFLNGVNASYDKEGFSSDKSEILKSIVVFFDFFNANRIYLPEDICNQVDDFMMDLRKYTIIYHSNVAKEESMLEKGNFNDDVQSSINNALQSAHMFVETSKVSRLQLEKKLRQLMSDSPDTNS